MYSYRKMNQKKNLLGHIRARTDKPKKTLKWTYISDREISNILHHSHEAIME